MGNVAVIGSQWGDEGKGKIVDWLSDNADIVVRFQGGHNAGHTLTIDSIEYKLSLLPSGIVRPGKMSVIGNGVVIDPSALIKEMETLKGQGVPVSTDNLMISLSAPIILPVHQRIDQAREAQRGDAKIGTTGRGIGPAYEDKVARRGLRMGDLLDMAALAEKTEALLAHHNVWLKAAGEAEITADEIIAPLEEMRETLIPFLGEVWALLDDYRRKGKRILFEGAQGVMLDIDHGTYPFVTSSNTFRVKRRQVQALARVQVDMCWALLKPIQRALAPARSRQKILVMMVRQWACVAVNLARSQGATPLRLV